MSNNLLKRIIGGLCVPALCAGTLSIPVSADVQNTAPLAPTGLLVNELENPLNTEAARFGWLVNDADNDEVQTAYEIVIKDAITGTQVYDTGKTASSEQSNISVGYSFAPCHPYTWQVKTWDKDGAASPYSAESSFATGFDTATENSAQWICSGKLAPFDTTGHYNHYWYIRNNSALDGTKTIKRAYAYFACMHDYELNINGTYIGRGQSFDYIDESHYQGWDITDAVKQDSETLMTAIIARYYGGGQGRAESTEALKGYIKVYYTDGTYTEIKTDTENWRVNDKGKNGWPLITGTNERNGEGDYQEVYGKQNELIGWKTKDFNENQDSKAEWTAASAAEVPGFKLTPELARQTEEIVKPVSVKQVGNVIVADFGKVIPARPYIDFGSTASGQYKITGGYVLGADGKINTAYNQGTYMNWQFTTGNAEDGKMYYAWDHLAFRYLQVEASSVNVTLTPDTLCAKLVHTQTPKNRESTFASSNSTLNEVYDMMKRSALYSMQTSFVDTPTREKGQFLQDSINISKASVTTQFERAVTRKAIMQFINSADRYWTGDNAGRLNSVYPNCDGARDIPDFTLNFPEWVYNYYMQTGDRELLNKAYPYVKNAADFAHKHIRENGLVKQLTGGDGDFASNYRYGIVDWPSAGRFGYDRAGVINGNVSTVNMLAKRTFDVTAELAHLSGHTADESTYKGYSDSLAAAINSNLVRNGLYCDGISENGVQSGHIAQHPNSYALAFGIVPEENIGAVADYAAGLGMKQGPMTADILVEGLFKGGRSDAVIDLLTNRNDYGWAKIIDGGGTFTFESWQADTNGSESQSHGWGSAAAADILENFAGVTVTEPGASRIKIAPAYTSLTSVDASVQTERGAVKVKYDRNDTSYEITVTVPANVKADLELPDLGSGAFRDAGGAAAPAVLGSGTYTFTYDGIIENQPSEGTVPVPTATPEPTAVPEAQTKSIVTEFTRTGIFSSHKQNGGANEHKNENIAAGNGFVTVHFSGTPGDDPSCNNNHTAHYTTISSNNDRIDMYNDGSYIMLTPKYDGAVKFKIGNRQWTNLYSTEELSNVGDVAAAEKLHNEGNNGAAPVEDEFEFDVTANKTYYIFNKNPNTPISVYNITYTYQLEPEPSSEQTHTTVFTSDGVLSGHIEKRELPAAGLQPEIIRVDDFTEVCFSNHVSKNELHSYYGAKLTCINDPNVNSYDSKKESLLMFNDGSYIKFTPQYDGVIELSIAKRDYTCLYCTTDPDNIGSVDNSVAISVVGTNGHNPIDDKVEMNVKAGEVYYIFNKNTDTPTDVYSITYKYNNPYKPMEKVGDTYVEKNSAADIFAAEAAVNGSGRIKVKWNGQEKSLSDTVVSSGEDASATVVFGVIVEYLNTTESKGYVPVYTVE